MPTITLGDLDQRVAALDARVRALEASRLSAGTSVPPEPRSADSGPENARLERLAGELSAENARHEEEIADLKRQLSALQALVRDRRVENDRLKRLVGELSAENARLKRLVDELREQLKVQTQDARYLRGRLAQVKEEARRELADELLEKLGVSNDE